MRNGQAYSGWKSLRTCWQIATASAGVQTSGDVDLETRDPQGSARKKARTGERRQLEISAKLSKLHNASVAI
jgi:hypothetical protein